MSKFVFCRRCNFSAIRRMIEVVALVNRDLLGEIHILGSCVPYVRWWTRMLKFVISVAEGLDLQSWPCYIFILPSSLFFPESAEQLAKQSKYWRKIHFMTVQWSFLFLKLHNEFCKTIFQVLIIAFTLSVLERGSQQLEIWKFAVWKCIFIVVKEWL
jgi:hypothetical protein